MTTIAKQLTTRQFIGLLKKPPKVQKPMLVEITPEIAYEALCYNSDSLQRPLKPALVAEYARRITVGEWPVMPDPIAFDEDGAVQNGQHRLHAIVESGVTKTMWVFFGQSRDLFAYYDIGKKRSPGDIFAINDVKNYTQAAAVTRAIYRYNQNTGRGHPAGAKAKVATPQETFEYYVALRPDDVQRTLSLYYQFASAKLPHPSAYTALYYVAREVDPLGSLADEYFGGLATGANLGPRSIEKKLRDFLMLNAQAVTRRHVSELVIRGWNARRLRRRSVSLAAPSDHYPQMV